jgi:predicted GIY-YIG superfamily endonuclease
MAKIADYTVAGKSGQKYTFEVYAFDSSWGEVAVVYLVTKRTKKPDGGGSHAHIYVGQTDNLKERFGSHHKADCFTSHGANCLCVLQESSEERRLAIESDILDGGNWPCND